MVLSKVEIPKDVEFGEPRPKLMQLLLKAFLVMQAFTGVPLPLKETSYAFSCAAEIFLKTAS